MKIRNPILISTIGGLLFACANGSELARSEADQIALDSKQSTRIQSFANGETVRANCKIQIQDDLYSFQTPYFVNLPITNAHPAGDVILTCEHEGRTKTAILKSRPAHSQNAVLTDTGTGNVLVATRIQSGSGTSGLDGLGDFLALGLSTNAAANAYYSYPRSVRLNF